MYEAAPGTWLCEGVTMAEHEAAMAGNYTGEDDYYLHDEMTIEERHIRAAASLKERDTSRTWRTRDGRVLKIDEMEQSHVQNVVAMLKRNGFDPAECVPNLLKLWTEAGS